MAVKIFRVNYKSDFILTLNSDAGWMTPFCIKFWTGAPSQAYFVGYDGTTYTHCAPVEGDPTKLLVQFDDHHLPIGNLQFQIAYHFTVADFPNDTEDEVINPASIIIEIDGEQYQVMLDFTGETAPEIEFSLPAYANEAQRIANEEQRIENEQHRISNEEARIAAETIRQQNEEQRIQQESARVNEFATLKSQSQAATRDANDAATLANQKAQLAADKAALADDAATLAIQKAQLAADKAALANDAAQLANEKAALAQQKAEYAQQQGGYAKDQGDYAKNQGDYAKEQGDTALADHQRAEADHGTAVDDHTQAGNDHTRAESDHGIAVDDHTQAGNDHTRAESDHGIAVDDHTQAGNDHTRAESDHGIAADDHTQAGNDHTRAESDHTRADSDHAAVEVYVDSLGAFDISAYHATGGVLAKYADLTAALGIDGANIPSDLRKGGMSVKFVQSYDNKYIECFLPKNEWSTNTKDWQKINLEEEVQELYRLNGVCAIANGSNGNSGNAYLVHTEVVSTKGARYAIIKVNKPNVEGYHYAFGWALTSSKMDIGTVDATNLWDGFLHKIDITATSTDFILDISSYPTAVGVSFTLGEYDSEGNYRTLRATDFAEGDVIISCQPGIDNLIEDKIQKEILGLDIISIEGSRGYYNGSGTFTNSNDYRTRYIDRSYFYGTQLIVGQCNFVHFFDKNNQWLSCFVSWSGTFIIQLSESDIPANCAFVVVCCLTVNAYLKLYNKDEYLATQRLTPFYPLLRTGTARYPSTKNNLSTAILFPNYGASSVKFTILKSAGTGLHYEILANLYTSVSQLTPDSVAPSFIGEWEATNIAEVNMTEYEGVAFTIRKVDGSGNIQTLDYTEFSEGEILMERIYVPERLIPVFNNNAFARNRDKEAMMAAAVRVNKKAEGSMDFMSLIVTDSHNDALSESNSVVMADNFLFIQSLIHCGDFCGNDATSFNADRYNRLLGCKKPFYFVAGNHDVGNSNLVSKCITNAQYYTQYVQPIVNAGLLSVGEYTDGKGYYYHDFTEKKIRLVVIYEYDDPNDLDPNDNTKYRYKRGDSVISQAQAEWFCSVLNSTPADYGIIVAMHNPFSALADCVTTAKFNDPDWVGGYGSQRLFSTDLWADIVDAWVNKSANYTCTMVCTGSASYLNTDGKYYEFSYDFSGRNTTAKFICFIGGHVHRDCVWRHRNYQYQYQITPVCSNSTYQQSPSSDIRRTNTDGLAKDSLTAIGYDYDNQAIRLVKLGVNVTEDMKARDYELIETQEI